MNIKKLFKDLGPKKAIIVTATFVALRTKDTIDYTLGRISKEEYNSREYKIEIEDQTLLSLQKEYTYYKCILFCIYLLNFTYK